MYICIYVYMYVCIYICMYVYIHERSFSAQGVGVRVWGGDADQAIHAALPAAKRVKRPLPKG